MTAVLEPDTDPPARSPRRPRTPRRGAVVLVLLAVAALSLLLSVRLRGQEPVALRVEESPAQSLEALVARADLVVVGHVVATSTGRVITSPEEPTGGVRTRLAQLVVDEMTVGPPASRLVLEEVAALADGRPATVEGLVSSQVGDAGLYLLVRGPDDRVALVGPQGRYLLEADDPQRLIAPLPADPLALRLARLGPRGLRGAILDATADRGSDSGS